jgi:hypothetical protein
MTYHPRRHVARWLGLLLVTGIALVAFEPHIVPQARYDSFPLFQSSVLWSVVFAAAVLLPFAVSFVLLLRDREGRLGDIGRGIAATAGLFAGSAGLFAIPLGLYALLWSGAGGPGPEATAERQLIGLQVLACVVIAVVGIGVAQSALRDFRRREGVGAAPAAAAMALLYAVGITSALMHAPGWAEARARAYRNRMKTESEAAESAMRTLANCAIGYRAANPGAALPTTLPAIVSVTRCDSGLALESAVPEYHLASVATTDGDQHAGCRFVAEFAGDVLSYEAGGQFMDGRALSSDCAGVVYEHERRFPPGAYSVTVQSKMGQAFTYLGSDLAQFADFSSDRSYPSSLRVLRDEELMPARRFPTLLDLGSQSADDLDANTVKWNMYVIRYTPATTGSGAPIDRYTLEARCDSYGSHCLRSYFVDDTGAIHGTGENRAATVADAVIRECEISTGSCDGSPARRIRQRR